MTIIIGQSRYSDVPGSTALIEILAPDLRQTTGADGPAGRKLDGAALPGTCCDWNLPTPYVVAGYGGEGECRTGRPAHGHLAYLHRMRAAAYPAAFICLAKPVVDAASGATAAKLNGIHASADELIAAICCDDAAGPIAVGTKAPGKMEVGARACAGSERAEGATEISRRWIAPSFCLHAPCPVRPHYVPHPSNRLPLCDGGRCHQS